MEEFENLNRLQAKFAAALANPLPGKRPILKLIRPHFKRPPFNRTHKILRRRHRKKDKNPEHYNVPVKPYFALRWVKNDHPVEPGPGVIVHMEQFDGLRPPAVLPAPQEEVVEEMDEGMRDPDDFAQEQFYDQDIPPVANGLPPPVFAQEQFYGPPPPPAAAYPEQAAFQNEEIELAQEQFYDPPPPPPEALPEQAAFQNEEIELAQEPHYDQPPPPPVVFRPDPIEPPPPPSNFSQEQDDDDAPVWTGPDELPDQALAQDNAPVEVLDQAQGPPSPPIPIQPIPIRPVVRPREAPDGFDMFGEDNNWSDSKHAPPLKKHVWFDTKNNNKKMIRYQRYNWI